MNCLPAFRPIAPPQPSLPSPSSQLCFPPSQPPFKRQHHRNPSLPSPLSRVLLSLLIAAVQTASTTTAPPLSHPRLDFCLDKISRSDCVGKSSTVWAIYT